MSRVSSQSELLIPPVAKLGNPRGVATSFPCHLYRNCISHAPANSACSMVCGPMERPSKPRVEWLVARPIPKKKKMGWWCCKGNIHHGNLERLTTKNQDSQVGFVAPDFSRCGCGSRGRRGGHDVRDAGRTTKDVSIVRKELVQHGQQDWYTRRGYGI
jgi:hypothetical protein